MGQHLHTDFQIPSSLRQNGFVMELVTAASLLIFLTEGKLKGYPREEGMWYTYEGPKPEEGVGALETITYRAGESALFSDWVHGGWAHVTRGGTTYAVEVAELLKNIAENANYRLFMYIVLPHSKYVNMKSPSDATLYTYDPECPLCLHAGECANHMDSEGKAVTAFKGREKAKVFTPGGFLVPHTTPPTTSPPHPPGGGEDPSGSGRSSLARLLAPNPNPGDVSTNNIIDPTRGDIPHIPIVVDPTHWFCYDNIVMTHPHDSMEGMQHGAGAGGIDKTMRYLFDPNAWLHSRHLDMVMYALALQFPHFKYFVIPFIDKDVKELSKKKIIALKNEIKGEGHVKGKKMWGGWLNKGGCHYVGWIVVMQANRKPALGNPLTSADISMHRFFFDPANPGPHRVDVRTSPTGERIFPADSDGLPSWIAPRMAYFMQQRFLPLGFKVEKWKVLSTKYQQDGSSCAVWTCTMMHHLLTETGWKLPHFSEGPHGPVPLPGFVRRASCSAAETDGSLRKRLFKMATEEDNLDRYYAHLKVMMEDDPKKLSSE